MKRNLTCIICPRGCSLSVEITDKAALVTGNGCQRGEKYAIDECTNPTRTVTSTVKIENRENTQVSVKTAAPVPKDKIFEVMRLIREKKACAPVHMGDIIIADVFGTDIVATKSID